jgi:hypothetical protein
MRLRAGNRQWSDAGLNSKGEIFMSGQARNRSDLETGLLYAAFGGITAFLSLDYHIGTAGEMGPGYFPFVLGLLLAAIGIGFIGKGLAGHGTAEAVRGVSLRATGIVFLSIMAFAATITTLGMVVAIPLVVIISLFASEDFSIKGAIAISLCLLFFSWLIFSYGLGVAMPLHPWSR